MSEKSGAGDPKLPLTDGRTLFSLELSFAAKSTRERWQTLIRDCGFDFVEESLDTPSRFIALPESVGPFIVYLTGSVVLDGKNSDEAHWSFEWNRAPRTPPPASLVQRSLSVGGFPVVLERLLDRWPTAKTIEKADIEAVFLVSPAVWRPKFGLRPNLAETAEVGGTKFELADFVEEWQLAPPAGDGIVDHIGLGDFDTGDEHLTYVSTTGTAAVELNLSVSSAIEDKLWNAILPFLEKSAP